MSVDWHQVFWPTTPPLEMVIRGTVVYLVLFTLMRVIPRREVGSTGITDLLFLVLLADAAQKAMSGQYVSLPDGLLLVGTIVTWVVLLDAAAYRWRWVAKLIQPKAMLIIRQGQLQRRVMRRELITESELLGELHKRGIHDLEQVERAWVEHDGQVSIVVSGTEPEASRHHRRRHQF